MNLDIEKLRKRLNLSRPELLNRLAPYLSATDYTIDEGMLAALERGESLSEERTAAFYEAICKCFPEECEKAPLKPKRLRKAASTTKPWLLYAAFLGVILVGAYLLWDEGGVAAGMFIGIVGLALSFLKDFILKK
ncbi:MAG: hypothetical protein AAFX04_11080 [Pseudomonadota bacterium]